VTAPKIVLNQDGKITTDSTGNIAAGNVAVKFTEKLSINPTSAITTSAVDGNGGSIEISGNGLLTLDRSTITTSVTGASGNVTFWWRYPAGLQAGRPNRSWCACSSSINRPPTNVCRFER
jgi:hypothetical protein